MQAKIETPAFLKTLILIAASLFISGCGPDVNDQQLVQTARTYLEQNKLREAALELKNALQINPDNPEARYLLANINLDVGDAASAEKDFRRAAEAGWQEDQCRIGQARAMILSRSYQKLLSDINAKPDYPENAQANINALRALASAGLGDTEQASKLLAVASNIDAGAFHVQKATIQLDLAKGNIEQANSSLNMALATFKNNPEILLLSAAMAAQGEDFTTAGEAYNNVLKQEPDELVTIYGRQARLGLARLQILNQKLDHAQATLLPLFKQYADDPETNFIGGLLAFQQGNLVLAEERLLTVLKLAPNHAPTQLLFGAVSYAQQDYEQSAYYTEKYLTVAPDNLRARKLLGHAYIKLGQHSEAQAALRPGLELTGDDAELLALVGLSQLQGGNYASGIEELEKAVNAEPESATLRSELAKAYITAGETETAIKELNKILASGGNKKEAAALLVSAHIKAGQYDKAINVVLDTLQKNPEDPAILSLAGNVFVQSNDRAEARKYFEKALTINPDYAPASFFLAKLEEIEDNPEKAKTLYIKLVDNNSEDITARIALARLAESQGKPDEMLDWLEKARAAATNDIRPHKVLAELYLRKKELDKATSLINEAIKIAPRDNSLQLLQAKIQIADKQSNKALSTLTELVTKSPNFLLARTLLAEVYLKLKQPDDAHTQLDIVLEKQPYYIPALILMTNLELQTGNYVNALAFAEKIQKINPDHFLGFELAGDVSMMKKDYATAKSNYQTALQHKKSPELVIKLSESSTRTGNFEAATTPLLAWLKENPEDTHVREFLGVAYQNMKQKQNAIETYKKVLEQQPDNIVALNNLAWLYSLENNPKSLELAEKAYTVNPDDAGIQDTYGWVLVQQGQADKGRKILELAVETLPDSPEVQYHYAVSLMKSGNEHEARKLLKQLLENHPSFAGRDDATQMLK